jgi:hypothetical protein
LKKKGKVDRDQRDSDKQKDEKNRSEAKQFKRDNLDVNSSIYPDGAPVVGVAADSSLLWLKELYEFGRQRAIDYKRTKVDKAELESLKAHALSMAEANRPLKWGSNESKALDDLIKAEIKLVSEKITMLEEKLERAKIQLFEAERERANFCRKPKIPAFPLIEIILAMFFFACSLISAFHDGLFFGLADDRLAWALSSGGALMVALPVVYFMLAGYRNIGESLSRYLGLFGGVAICIGFAAIRVWSADSSESALLLGVSNFLLEIGLLAVIEGYAIPLRKSFTKYRQDMVEWERMTGLIEVSRMEVEDINNLISGEKTRLAKCVKTIETRISMTGKMDSLKEWAVRTITDGYLSGIALNNAAFHKGGEDKEDNKK